MTGSRHTTRLAVDIGGTFTDVVLEAGARTGLAKLLTTPRAPEEAVIEGIRRLLDDMSVAAGELDLVLHGTTLATNAIIERKGAVTALVTTEGFRDVIEIAHEDRFDQYDVFIRKPPPLVPRRLRFTVRERIDVGGQVLQPLDEAGVRETAVGLREHGVQSVAIGFLHSYMNPIHEERAREILSGELPGIPITTSFDACPEMREYERFSTTVANAYVQPMMASYLERLAGELERMGVGCPVLLMTSGGGLTTLAAAVRFPIRLVESGPAGGAILAAHIAGECGLAKVLSYDMGGTTAKICLIEDGQAQSARSFEVDRAARFIKGSGLPLRIPVIEMVEIGAGGGSIARVNELSQIAVGPDSAGSEPGPACYGRGGEAPTVTDADVVLGRIDPQRFAGGRMTLAPEHAEAALARDVGTPLDLTLDLAAYGVAEMVDENMANAARVHAVERGKDVSEFTLVAFGGAAPLHAARLAEKLDLDRVVVPTNAGVGSAVGFLRASIAYEVVRSRYLRLKDFDPGTVNALYAELRAEAQAVVEPAAGGAPIGETRLAYMRYVGQGHEIAVPVPAGTLGRKDAEVIRSEYDRLYAEQFARIIPDADIEVLTWSLTLATPRQAPDGAAPRAQAPAAAPRPVDRRAIFDPEGGGRTEVPVYLRADLGHGQRVAGPCLIAENETSTFVSATFDAGIDARGYIVLDRKAG